MKKLILSFFVLTSVLFSQTTNTTYIFGDSLKTKNVSLVKSWDFHSGDDSTWALPTFNSVDWDAVDSRLIADSIKKNYWTGIGWFRKTIVIDSSLINKTIGLVLDHYGASKIYLNGKFIGEYGTVSDSAQTEIIYKTSIKPIVVRLDSALTYTLAIKYSNHLPIKNTYLFPRLTKTIGFTATLMDWNRGFDKYSNFLSFGSTIGAGIVGIFMSLSVIYLLLFLFYSSKMEYLYYTIFTFSMGILFSFGLLNNIIHSNLTFYFGRTFLLSFFLLSIFISVISFLYKIFYGRMLKIITYFIIVAVIGFLMSFINDIDYISDKILFGLIIIFSFEILRVIILSIKRKKPNAWVIGAGVSFFAGFIIISLIIGMFFGGIEINNLYLVFTFLLSIPISMSLYLARSSAQTNENLALQLSNVQKLSNEAIEQERKNAELKLQAELAEAENIRKTKELEEARELQLSMLPKKLPELPNLDIAVYMKTATEVGGDYYDFHVGLDGTFTVVLGDATGHGMKAGTMVTATKALFGSYADNKNILNTFHEMTRCLKELNFNMLSMCLALVKIKGSKITMSSAGIPPILVYRAKEDKVDEFVIKGMPLGTFDKFPYKVVESQLESGDTILIMSDGFPELMNEQNQMYGYQSVSEFYRRVAINDPEKIISEFKNEIQSWANGKDPNDDVTFVVVKVK